MPKRATITTYLNYSASIVTFLFGSIILSGVVFQYVPNKLRIAFGVVLVLWGLYRFVTTRTQVRQQHEEDEEE
jgi:small neutral amino acid transporter SnatA (MarC family)